MNKDIKKLLFVNVFLAISGGLFYNFLELWLTSNNMSLSTVSTVLSLSALITVSTIFICSNIIKQNKQKRFCVILILIKFLIMMVLYFLYKTNINVLIKFLVMIDYAINVEICASMYPLISVISKDDKLFARRSLLYEIFYYISALIATYLLGKNILSLSINYNSYILISSIFLIIAGIILYNVDLDKYNKKDERKNNYDILFKLIKKIKKDNTTILYLLYIVFNDISFYGITGILLTIIIKEFNLIPVTASYIKLFSCILAVGIGLLILEKLTCKNNYINLSIKLIGRIIVYLLPIIYLCKYTIIIALAYTVLTSSSYVHITDAPYINRLSKNEQLPFANLREMIGYFSRAIGTFLCGLCLAYNFKYNFIIAIVFSSLATIVIFKAQSRLNIERKDFNDR